MYKITPYTYEWAKKLNLIIYPSRNPKKKIEVYNKEGKFLFYIGDANYMDFQLYLIGEKNGIYPKGTAIKRRKAYYTRHRKDIEMGGKGYVSAMLLW